MSMKPRLGRGRWTGGIIRMTSFCLREKIVRQAENRICLVAREKIAAEVEILLDEFGRRFKDGNIFVLILTALPWQLNKSG